ncbi:hypothetical protein [Streptomyces sp. NPDC002889]|uniref:hypothetical protein n=1 Tax=Streptomyces sp. NPDC002889 TaxID=3364669 RepID=UPI0036AB67EC
MPFEDELGDALRRTGDTLRPADRPALVDGGLKLGRRRLARRRAAAVTGSVLALTVVGAAGAYTSGVFGADDSGKSVASRAEIPELVIEATDGKVTAREMITTLKGLLPKGEVLDEGGRGSSTGRGSMPYASVVFDDGKGAAAISVSLNTVDPDGESAKGYITCPSQAQVQHESCKAETLADGSKYMLFQGYEYPDRREDTKNWRATLITKAGVLIDASEYNAPAQKGAAVTRTDPPLSAAHMKSLVTGATWQPLLERFLQEAGAPTKEIPDPGAISSDAVHKTLASMLPEGVKVTDKGGRSGYGFVVADDGKGKGFVGVNVQPGMGDIVKDVFAKGFTTLPDGTKVIQRQEADPDQKGGEGTVGWTVDTLRPDGFRVVIMAFNAPAQGQDASRPEPVLTMKQLRDIALDEKWLNLK